MTVGDKLRTLSDVELALMFTRFFMSAYKFSQKFPGLNKKKLEILAVKVEIFALKKFKSGADTADWSFLNKEGE